MAYKRDLANPLAVSINPGDKPKKKKAKRKVSNNYRGKGDIKRLKKVTRKDGTTVTKYKGTGKAKVKSREVRNDEGTLLKYKRKTKTKKPYRETTTKVKYNPMKKSGAVVTKKSKQLTGPYKGKKSKSKFESTIPFGAKQSVRKDIARNRKKKS